MQFHQNLTTLPLFAAAARRDAIADDVTPAGAQKAARGTIAYLGGCAAEDQVARHYARRGFPVCHKRWRCESGEIDLIARDGSGGLIFIEVKASRNHARAAQALGRRQRMRIYATAEAFLGSEPMGSLTPARFDVALVDGHGAIRIIENAFGLDA